jgi:hypothetical protein
VRHEALDVGDPLVLHVVQRVLAVDRERHHEHVCARVRELPRRVIVLLTCTAGEEMGLNRNIDNTRWNKIE